MNHMPCEGRRQSRTRVKVCGITRAEDALCAAGLGVDALGFVFFSASPRYITPLAAAAIIRGLPPFVSAVGLFVNATQQEIDAVLDVCPLDVLQMHGDETPAFCAAQSRRVIKAVAVREAADILRIADFDCAVLLDAKAPPGVYGGTGQVFDWALVEGLQHAHPLLLAGGLDADNVSRALAVRQWDALDVSSGVEISPGIKDDGKLRQFMAAIEAVTATASDGVMD
ncbi:MAG: N-(5'-phosphoribosyl)anthranilate isomerase [Zetaproteobacteria bacterium CG1_02_55_237]|nr:MAG: N-(5'-phosphoribosyl)anthranilate isomerase [Zetaproteobacteria bacterium CG1_02_55_237]